MLVIDLVVILDDHRQGTCCERVRQHSDQVKEETDPPFARVVAADVAVPHSGYGCDCEVEGGDVKLQHV